MAELSSQEVLGVNRLDLYEEWFFFFLVCYLENISSVQSQIHDCCGNLSSVGQCERTF